jgi:protein O-mannosyl-transferase
MEYVGKKHALSSSQPSEALLTPIHDSLFSFPPPKAPPAQKREYLIAFFILAIVILAAYSNSFQAGFAQDNRGIILEDARLRTANSENLQKIFQENYWWPKAESGLYRPVTTLTYLFNYSILGEEDKSAGYHWINLVLHLCNAFLVYLLAKPLFGDRRPALATAALWALHPICTESVTNIVGRADELAALGVLATILLYIRSSRVHGWRRAVWLIAMAAIVTMAVFSKENAVIVAALLPLYDLSFRTARRQANLLRDAFDHMAMYCFRGYVVLIPPLLLFIHQRISMFHKGRPVLMPFVDNPILGADFVAARLTAFKIFGRSLWLLLWPQQLSCDYSFNQIPLVDWRTPRFEDWQALAGLASMVALLVIAIACWRRNRPAFFWIGFASLTILPTSNLLVPIGSIMAERFLYLPAIGFAACLVMAISAAGRRLHPSSRWIVLAIVAIAMGWGIRTFQRNRDWANDETLWTQALTTSPNSFRVHNSLAEIWFEREGSSQRVIREAERAVAILNQLPDRLNAANPYADLGQYYLSKGDSIAPRGSGVVVLPGAEALQWYLKASAVLRHGVAVDREHNASVRRRMAIPEKNSVALPTFGLARLHSFLGLTYLRLDAPEDAVGEYLYDRMITPGNPAAYRALAAAYLKAGKTQAAAVSLWGAFVVGGSGENVPYLLRFYDDKFPQSCATYFHDGQEFVNTSCPLVQGHLCGAYVDTETAYSEAGQTREANEDQNASRVLACQAAPRLP